MSISKISAALFVLIALVGCSKHADENQWWSSMTSPGKNVVEVLNLGAHEKKTLVIRRDGRARLGILVREVEEMKSRLKKDGDDLGGVFLTQSASDKHIGTYYSASDVFDLSAGRDFVVENRSPVASDILVYHDPKL